MKLIRENKNYMIDVVSGHIERVGGLPLDLERTEDSVKIALYGIERWVKLSWLTNLVKYDIWLPKHSYHRVFDIEFHNGNDTNHTEKIITIINSKEPIYLDKQQKFAICLRYSRYAVDIFGNVISIQSYAKVKVRDEVYFKCPIYDHVENATIKISVHRLVGLTYVYNNDFITRGCINHIDTNKHNNHYKNLEWVSPKTNNMHASINNLNVRAYPVLCKNIHTDQVTKHASVSLASMYIGRSKLTGGIEALKPGVIWTGTEGKFEIKLESDPTPWKYNTDTIIETNRKVTKYYVKYLDGGVRVFYGVKELTYEYLGVLGTLPVETVITRIKERFPLIVDIIIEGTSNKAISYEARNTITAEVFEGYSNLDLARKIGVSKSTITKAISKKDAGLTYNDWQIRVKSDDPWPPCKNEPPNTPKWYVVKNTITGEENLITSERELSKQLSLNRLTLRNDFKKTETLYLKNYIITKIERTSPIY